MLRSVTGSLNRLGRRGTTVVEMALVANILVLLVLAGIETGRWFIVSESVKYVIGEVARASLINPISTTGTTPWRAAIAKASVLRPANFSALVVTVTRKSAPELSTIEVTASYSHRLLVLPWSAAARTIDNFVKIPVVLPPPS